MSIVDDFRRLEARAAMWASARRLVLAGVTLIAIALFGHWVDSRREAEADGAIHVLERETAIAQQQRHAATVASIVAKQQLAAAKAHADSLEASAHLAEIESDRLGQLVHIASETLLVAAVTPDSTINVPVPRVVTAYITSLYATIKAQDAALVARDTQTVKADTVIVTVDRVVSSDSTVINSQASTISEEKSARPRFGFKAGVLTGILAAIIIHVLF